MRNILAAMHRDTLVLCARSRVLLAFDFDGTLAPIVRDPDKARMRPRTRSLLHAIALRYPCAVVSGRARRDVLARLEGIRLVEVVGNHGAEAASPQERFTRPVGRWVEALKGSVGGIPGVAIEDKVFSVAVHYRAARRKGATRRAIARSTESLQPARIFGGKEVVNLVAEGAPHKGVAVERIRVRLGCARTLYVGDDATDEDVFRFVEPERLLGIRVGRRASSRAAWFIERQASIDALLALLLEARAAARTDP